MKMRPQKLIWVAALGTVFAASPLVAQEAIPGMDMSGMDRPSDQPPAAMPGKRSSMHGWDPAMQQPPPPTTGQLQRLDIGQRIGVRPVVRGLGLKPMRGDAMQGMPPMQGGSAPPNARSPDYSEGVGYGEMTGMDMVDDAPHSMLLIDQLEYVDGAAGNSVGLDAQAWYGGDIDKIWLKAEGERSAGQLEDLRLEALWDHAVSAYWNTQLGARHDTGQGPNRNWAAFGVQGLAPYWFDIEATAYVGPSGRTAARFEAEYALLFTQRLILTPDLEVNMYGKDDPDRRIGSGVSDVQFGLRLRYEIRRQFAPYIGVNWVRRIGTTADYARQDRQPVLDRQWVAGLRMWF